MNLPIINRFGAVVATLDGLPDDAAPKVGSELRFPASKAKGIICQHRGGCVVSVDDANLRPINLMP